MSEPFNELKQVEMAIGAAQKMVGTATMSMDPDQLKDADAAVNQAREQLQQAIQLSPSTDQSFYETSSELLERCAEQLREANR